MFLVFISLLLVVPYFVLFLYYRKGWLGIRPVRENGFVNSPLPFLSVVIPARNEADRIGPCLESLAVQDYPTERFEVIVVNDYSEDNTATVVSSFCALHPQFRLLELSDFVGEESLNSYKKKAIEIGISQSMGEWIVTTDADCTASPGWLNQIGNAIRTENPGMIAAPVMFTTSGANNYFQKLFYIFQALDFMAMQGITGAALFRKLHYLANGANLSYSKKLFEEVGGFSGIDGLASGDDVLLMEKIGFSRNIIYLKSAEAIVHTSPEATIKSFFSQRIRWAGKSSFYTDTKIKAILALVYATNAFTLVFLVSLFFSPRLWVFMLTFFILKVITELWFLYPVSRFFDQQKLLRYFVFLQPLHIIYILIAGWLGAFGSYQWKGRRVR